MPEIRGANKAEVTTRKVHAFLNHFGYTYKELSGDCFRILVTKAKTYFVEVTLSDMNGNIRSLVYLYGYGMPQSVMLLAGQIEDYFDCKVLVEFRDDCPVVSR